jgi:hypothetical protein
MTIVAVNDSEWARIEIDDGPGRVTVLERWGYQWTQAPGASAWTLDEQQAFHSTLVDQLRTTFSGVSLTLKGTAPLCKKYKTMTIRFDVGWALEEFKHWTVFVRKMPPRSTPTTYISYVDPPARTVYLDSADVGVYTAVNAAGQSRPFRVLPHEFVHTLTGTVLSNFDEYGVGSPHLSDTDSILNLGSLLRPRHLTVILKQLNTMVPHCTFAA